MYINDQWKSRRLIFKFEAFSEPSIKKICLLFRGVRGWSEGEQDQLEIISTSGGRIALLSEHGSALFYPGKYGTKITKIKANQYQGRETRFF